MLPFSGQHDSKNLVQSSVCAYAPLSVYSVTMATHRSRTVVFEWTRISVELEIFWVSNNFADRSSFSHWFFAAISSTVEGFDSAGQVEVPSK